MQDYETNGTLCMQGFKEYYGPEGKNIFFKDQPKSPGSKIIVTDEDADLWQAAHFGMTVDNVPTVCP